MTISISSVLAQAYIQEDEFVCTKRNLQKLSSAIGASLHM